MGPAAPPRHCPLALLVAACAIFGTAGDIGSIMDGAAAMVGCGIVDRPTDFHFQCNDPEEHDCTSMIHLTHLCPLACPFVAPHPELNCVFECTAAVRCSGVNTEFAYPNNSTRLCEPCSVVGCKRCSSPDTCQECFSNFRLKHDGHVCMYVWDEGAWESAYIAAAVAVVLGLFVFAVVAILDYCKCCGRCLSRSVVIEDCTGEDADGSDNPEVPLVEGGNNAKSSRTLGAISQGKRHRLRCKVHDLEIPPHATPESYFSFLCCFAKIPFWMDLQSRFLVGVGLPLFYQWYYFLFIYSVLMCAGTVWVYYGSDLGKALQQTGFFDQASHLVMGNDAMSLCGLRARRDQLGQAVRAFAQRSEVGYLVLWVVGLLLSLAHAARQKRVAAAFHLKHPCLAEFALNIEGFPPEATDEAQIRQFLREIFGSEALEVSVCYDYRSRRARVHELLEKVLVSEDVRAGTYDAGYTVGPSAHSLGLTASEKAEVRGWLDPSAPDGLRNAGCVFAVLPHNYDLQLARSKFSKGSTSDASCSNTRMPMLPHCPTPDWLPPLDGNVPRWVGADGKMYPVVIRDVVCEPPDIVWENMGLEKPRLVCGYIMATIVIVISFVTFAAVIFVPLATYVISYVHQAGSMPTGFMMTLQGTLVMTANWLMCLLHISVSSQVGFARRDREGLLLFKSFAMLCLVSFLFNVAITLFPESSKDPFKFLLQPIGAEKVMASIQDVSFQVKASEHLFHVLVPGSLFIGYLIFPLQGFVWPFVYTLAKLRCWYRRSWSADLTAREAELQFEPLGMSVGHDYMGHVVQPVCCSLLLFFASSMAWRTFACLAVWSLFMVPLMRYLHLRAERKCYITTNRTDTEALFIWGVPLSMVLAASCFWGARLRGWPMHLVPVAWVCGFAFYTALLALCIRPLSLPKSEGRATHRPSYDEMRIRRLYDWHNCNPIKVLLSHCSKDASEPLTPFSIGKEYLQATAPNWHARMKRAVRGLPRTTSTAIIAHGNVGWLGLLASLAVPEVETLIQQPLDIIAAMGTWFGMPQGVLPASPQASLSASRRDPLRGGAAPDPAGPQRELQAEEHADD